MNDLQITALSLLVFTITYCSFFTTDVRPIPEYSSELDSCQTDTFTRWIKLWDFETSNDSCDYQWDDWNACGYGDPAVITICDDCSFDTCVTEQYYMFQMFAGDVVKADLAKGMCLKYEIFWNACAFCPFPSESPVHDTLGIPVQIAIYDDSLCTNQVWPSVPLSIWPTQHLIPITGDSLNPQKYPGIAVGSKTITSVCPPGFGN